MEDIRRVVGTRAGKLRIVLWLVLFFASYLSFIYFEVTDPLGCGDSRDHLHPRQWLPLSFGIAAMVVLFVMPPRIRMRDSPDRLTATLLMVTITSLLALYLYLGVTPVC